MTPEFTQRYKEIFMIVLIAAALFSACFATYSYLIKPLMRPYFGPLSQGSPSAPFFGGVQNPLRISSKVLPFNDGAPLDDGPSTQSAHIHLGKELIMNDVKLEEVPIDVEE